MSRKIARDRTIDERVRLPGRGASLTMYDLPSEGPEDGLPDEFHLLQPRLLSETFQPMGVDPALVFTATNLYVYFDEHRPQWHKRPDWFAAVGVPRRGGPEGMRLSYVMWQERVAPLIVVELLSPGTKDEDLGQREQIEGETPAKWTVYERILKVPYYVVFDRATNELWQFELRRGRYRPARLKQGRLWVAEARVGLGLWDGSFDEVERSWLRWFDEKGDPIPNRGEDAERRVLTERKAREEAERRALAEREARARERKARREAEGRARRLAERLRALGEDPDLT